MSVNVPTVHVADANFLLRLFEPAHPHHGVAQTALRRLSARGDALHVAAQSLFEFYVVATRPATSRGGLGFTPAHGAATVVSLQNLFPLVPETPLLPRWLHLVQTYGTSGLPAHDARLAAAILEAGYTHLLTFNGGDFTRYAPEGLQVVDPATL